MSTHSAGRPFTHCADRGAPRTRRHHRVLHRVHHRADRRTAVGIGATVLTLIAGVLAILGAATALGLSSITFASGSMEPAVAEGSVAITRAVDPADLSVGDVASVVTTGGERVTHRVMAVEDLGDGATALTLRGDANAADDPAPYVVESADEVLAVVPSIGVVDAVPLVLAAAVATVLVAGILLRRRWDLGAAATLVVASTLVVTAGTAGATSAFWTDAATATTAPWTTVATTPSPSAPGCADHLDHVDASFANVGQRYRYRATLHRIDAANAGVQVAGEQYLTQGTGATITRDVLREGFGGSSLAQIQASGQYNFVVRIRAVPVGNTTWLSSSFVSIPVRFTAGYSTLRCGNDTTTTVDITSIGQDSGTAGDYITNVAGNTVRGTGEVGATIVLRRAGVSVGTTTVLADGTWSIPVTLSEGSASYTATATDFYGNTATDTQAIVLDTVAPTVSVAAPCTSVGNAVTGVTGATWCKVVSQAYTASFADTGGSGLVPGTGSQVNNDGAGFVNYTASIGMSEKNGRVMQARATDVAGNSTTVSNTYYIDGTAPTLSITQPAAGTGLFVATLRSNVTTACGAGRAACGPFTDAISGPASAQWKLERTPALGATNCMNAAGTYSASNCNTTYPVTSGSGQFWIPVAPSTAYASLITGYTLTISGITDAAGNVATGTVTRSFSTVL